MVLVRCVRTLLRELGEVLHLDQVRTFAADRTLGTLGTLGTLAWAENLGQGRDRSKMISRTLP